MTKNDELRKEITDLREKLGVSQAEFAEMAGVKQPNISAWESAEAVTEPSNESLMALGNLAGYPKCLWFWERAGMNPTVMLAAAGKLLQKSKIDPPKGRVIEVNRILSKGQQKGSSDVPWLVDAKDIPNPGAVAYWEGEGKGVLYRSGTRVLLDTSDNHPVSLEAFWDDVVLIEAPENQGNAVYLAEIILHSPSGHPDHIAILRPFCPIEERHSVVNAMEVPSQGTISVGHWDFARSPNKEKLKDKSGNYNKRLTHKRAEEELKLLRGWTVLGRALYVRFPSRWE